MSLICIRPKNILIDDCINLKAYDKSISHRSIIFSFLTNKKSRIKNLLIADDVLHSLRIAIMLGMEVRADNILIDSNFNLAMLEQCKEFTFLPNAKGIIEPNNILYCGNSGTTIRLYIGLLSRISGYFVLSGDKYLNKRPMDRIIDPLVNIGANIYSRSNNTFPPVSIIGSKLRAFNYKSKISSAQVKSAMILSALGLDSISKFYEYQKSRDHSENMLIAMGASIKTDNCEISISPINNLEALDITIPVDPSSAFYFAILAAILPNSRIRLTNVLLNKTRIEAFYILSKMGVKVEFFIKDSVYEIIGDIVVSSSKLVGVEVKDNISWLIDEIPALSIAFALASGESRLYNASELRFKESDRISAILAGLCKFGVECIETDDGFIIKGGIKYNKARINSFGDHRIAMSFAILGVLFDVEILDYRCVITSFPTFFEVLSKFANVEYRRWK